MKELLVFSFCFDVLFTWLYFFIHMFLAEDRCFLMRLVSLTNCLSKYYVFISTHIPIFPSFRTILRKFQFYKVLMNIGQVCVWFNMIITILVYICMKILSILLYIDLLAAGRHFTISVIFQNKYSYVSAL